MTLHGKLVCSFLVPVSPPQMSFLTTLYVTSLKAYLSTLFVPQTALLSLRING